MLSKELVVVGADVSFPSLRGAPWALMALILFLLTIISATAHIDRAAPRDGREAGLIVEGARFERGRALYELAPDGHATSMYGPLMPVTLGLLFRFTGARNDLGRWINLLSALGLALTLAVVLKAGWLETLIGFTLFFSVHLRVHEYWVDTRPDLVAYFLSLLGVLSMYCARSRDRLGWAVVGAFFFVLGFLFKQSAGMLALVPPAALWLEGAGLRAQLKAWLPVAVLLVLGIGLAVRAPVMFHYLSLASQYPIRWALLPGYGAGAIVSVPLAVALVWERFRGGRLTRPDTSWWLAGACVTWACCVLAICKQGGNRNSLIPFYLAFLGLAIQGDPIRGGLSTIRGWKETIFLAGLGLMSVLPMRGELWAGEYLPMVPPVEPVKEWVRSLVPRPQDLAYDAIVEAVRALPGRVASPEDPTILLHARSQLSRVGLFELDNSPRDREDFSQPPPAGLRSEIEGADFYVSTGTWASLHFPSEWLERLGFEVYRRDLAPYTIWKRRGGG